MMKYKRLLSVIVACAVTISALFISGVAVNAESEPSVIPYSSHVTSYIGTNVKIEFKLFHVYYDERLFVDVYDSNNNVVASSDDYFDENDSDEQTFTFTWLAKKFAAGEYTLYATAAYYTDGEWKLCKTDAVVAITLKPIPAPKLKSAVNVKKGKVTAKWSSVKNASKYQVKIGSKTYISKKTSFTSKKLKKGKTYGVKVRTYMNKKWSKWSNTKKVKIKK